MTEAERALWRALRSKQLGGCKFRRQYPIAGSIADFACIESGLVIELDGGQHAERIEDDDMRTEYLNQAGYRVVRFWNNEVLANMEGVLEVIQMNLSQPHPNPPLLKKGRE